MAQFKHISSSLRLTISLGEEEGKTVTKTVSLSNIGAAATADTLSALASALGELLEYPRRFRQEVRHRASRKRLAPRGETREND